MDFGEKLKRLRKEKGLSQQKLAEKAGVSQASIHCYETGRRNPRDDTIIKIANALEVEPSALVGKNIGVVGLTRRLDVKYADAIRMIVEHYGYEHQKVKYVDEMAELMHALLDGKSIFDIVDEMADVRVMSDEIEDALGIREQVDARIEYKINRQLKRMESENRR